MTLTRRDFLTAAGTGAVGAMVGGAWGATQATEPITSVENPLRSYPNRDWEDVYREIYAYDEVDWTVCHPNCTQSCALNFYMKNGVPIRAEQVYHEEEGSPGPGGPGGYENADVTQHWNPRGCMKGLSLHRRTFEPSRIKYPMVRKGWDPDDPNQEGRGEDEFERVSWEEAFDLIAEKMASLEDNKQFHIFNAIKADGLITRHGAGRRLASIFGGCEWTEYDWYADLPPGHVITTGYQTSDADASAWRQADYTIMQGKNLIHNKLADNHFLQETRERGGKMVGVYPDYSPTVQKCDRWLPVRPGSDPAFALGVAHVIIDEERYDADFMRQFTSLPLLVREDDGKYLRAHEVFEGHEAPPEDVDHQNEERDWGDFVAVGRDGDLVAVDRESVGSETPDEPRLDVDREVELADGSTVSVRSDFARQRDNIMEHYDPETVEDITTIPADKLRQTAREFADAEKGQWFTGEGINHWFHSNDSLQRTIFFVQSMLGNIGERGAGYYNYSGQYKIELLDGYPEYVNPDGHSAHGMYPGYAFAFFGGESLDPHQLRGDFDEELDLVPQEDAEDPVMPEGADTYTMSKPRVLWTMNCNLLNQTKHQQHVVENFVKHPETSNELFVVSDMHMTYSARHADIVLPVPSWLECEYPDITVGPENPFLQMDSGVMDPIYDTMQDGEAVARVAEKLDEKTDPAERNVDSYREYFAEFLDEDGDVTNYIQQALDAGMTTRDIDVEDLEDGPERLQLKTYPRVPFWGQVHEDRPFYTKTGRMEFHKEEDRFLELNRSDLDHVESVEGTPYGRNKTWDEAKDEENPIYHDQEYQFYYNTPHPKYRTHSSWGMTDWNLIWASRDFGSVSADPEGTDRLVEDFSFPTGDGESEDAPPLGEAFVEIHPEDAADMDVENGDYVRIGNDRGSLVVRAMVSERQRPRSAGDMGQLTIWHGWWPQHFPEDEEADEDAERGYNVTTNLWLDPLQETDDLVHKAVFGDPNISEEIEEEIAWHGAELEHGYEETVWAPTGTNRDDLVEVEKYEEADWWPGDARRDDLIEDYIGGSLQPGTPTGGDD